MISHNYLSSRGVVFFGGANFDREGPPGGFLLSNSVDIYIYIRSGGGFEYVLFSPRIPEQMIQFGRSHIFQMGGEKPPSSTN